MVGTLTELLQDLLTLGRSLVVTLVTESDWESHRKVRRLSSSPVRYRALLDGAGHYIYVSTDRKLQYRTSPQSRIMSGDVSTASRQSRPLRSGSISIIARRMATRCGQSTFGVSSMERTS